jgi:hypothetical protein
VRKVVVPDAHGARWTVGVRRLRSTETAGPMSRPEEESLRRRLADAVAAVPHLLDDPLRGRPAGWRTPGDTDDVARREARAQFRCITTGGAPAPWELTGLIVDLVDHLRTPWSDTWRVEAVARGRIRRWARWEMEGLEAASRAVATVSAALAAGEVPGPEGAVLVDVVDQRPAGGSLRSAGLGGEHAAR